MKFNRFNQFLFNQAGDVPDAGGDGLSARLEQFMSGHQFDDKGNVIGEVKPVVSGDPPAPEPAPTPAPPEPAKQDPPPADPKPTDPPASDEEEFEEFPDITSKKPASQPADLDFDAQTEAIVKAIEAKGHPGDEYKRLRAELKELRQRKPIDDLDSIPEVKELKMKAAEAERLKAEADALRERQRELLRANDEVAVKESDEYINAVRTPLREMESVVQQISESIEVDADTLFSIIAEPNIAKQDKMLEALHQKVGSRMAGRIERFCDDYKAISSKGAAMLADASKNAERARLAREQAIRQEEEQKVELFRTSVEASFEKYAKNIPGFTDSSKQLTDVAKSIMARTATIDITTLGPDDLGYMAFAANALPEARKHIKELREEIALLKGSKPAPRAIDGKPAAPPAPEDDFQGLSDRMKGMEFTFTPPS